MIHFDRLEVVSFDCYGTLIDYESGILGALRPFLARHGVRLADDAILEAYARLESEAQRGLFAPYRHVLGRVMRGFAREHGFRLEPDDWSLLAESLPAWLPFEDTVEALRRLARRYRLAVISNVDDDLFECTRRRLPGVEFDWVITAETAQSYKPSHRNFEVAERKMGIPRGRWLHVAQSLYHDIAPAKRMGLATVWVNRRRGRSGFGATPPAAAAPDLEVFDLGELAARAVPS
ncbi:MAG: haloacid dehalogenase type II [Candidatus Eiseniibacteriota bacterium]